MTSPRELIVYWDSSAVLSALFLDEHSKDAAGWSARKGVHLLSTLSWAEVHAVIRRIEVEKALAEVLIKAAREALARGPWHRLNATPEWSLVERLSLKWSLRGADLWHLATAKSLQADLRELRVLSYGARLAEAARGEGLVGRHVP